MSSLVQVVSNPYSKTPLLVEVPVPKELEGPFLVTSSKSQIWVENKFPSGNLRSAIIRAPRDFLFRSCLLKVFEQAKTLSWGSVHPTTRNGVEGAIEHLAYYGLVEVEVLFGDGFNPDFVPEGIPTAEEIWVPQGWAVVLPQEKSYVGTLFDFGQERNSIVIHNASRGIGLVVPETN